MRLADMEAAKTFMLGKAEEMKARYILRQNDPALAELGLERALAASGARLSVWNGGAEEPWIARAAEADSAS